MGILSALVDFFKKSDEGSEEASMVSEVSPVVEPKERWEPMPDQSDLSPIASKAQEIPPMIERALSFDWPDDWGPVHPDEVDALNAELKKEVVEGHALYGKSATVLGSMSRGDDFLFQIEDADHRFARVHLTWKEGSDSSRPSTTLFSDFRAFTKDCNLEF